MIPTIASNPMEWVPGIWNALSNSRVRAEPFDLRRSGGHDGYRRRPMQRVCHG